MSESHPWGPWGIIRHETRVQGFCTAERHARCNWYVGTLHLVMRKMWDEQGPQTKDKLEDLPWSATCKRRERRDSCPVTGYWEACGQIPERLDSILSDIIWNQEITLQAGFGNWIVFWKGHSSHMIWSVWLIFHFVLKLLFISRGFDFEALTTPDKKCVKYCSNLQGPLPLQVWCRLKKTLHRFGWRHNLQETAILNGKEKHGFLMFPVGPP